jgi:hypothetical protein
LLADNNFRRVNIFSISVSAQTLISLFYVGTTSLSRKSERLSWSPLVGRWHLIRYAFLIFVIIYDSHFIMLLGCALRFNNLYFVFVMLWVNILFRSQMFSSITSIHSRLSNCDQSRHSWKLRHPSGLYDYSQHCRFHVLDF